MRREILTLRRGNVARFDTALDSLVHEICGSLELSLSIAEVPLEEDASHELLQISREILRNVVAHARATRLEVKLYLINNRVFIEFSDDGIGGARMSEDRWGLIGIAERITALGGNLTMESKKGTRISILL